MIYPESIYRYKRHVSPEGKKGTRWDYVNHEGKEYPGLVHTLKRTGEKVIYRNKFRGNPKPGRPKEGFFRGKGESITGFFEPDIKRPGLGYGDLGDRANAALIIRVDYEAGTLTIMVFPGLGKGSGPENLFNMHRTGAVKESVLNNNITCLQKVLLDHRHD